jgi:uncharacterized protein
MTLTLSQARAMLLAAQGLLEPPAATATPESVLDAIRRMRILQIDTIHVVARSPYLVLWSRLGAYQPRWLDDLLARTQLFEYWAHAACFIPIEDYPLYRRSMLEGQRGWYNPDSWLSEHRELVELVMQRIRQEGPLRSADFESEKAAGGWWNWKEEKLALEHLLTHGDLMVRARKNFQRVYDLRERVLPEWDDAQTPTLEEVRRTHLLRAVTCLGVARAHWAADYFRIGKTNVAKDLANLAREGALLTETVDGWTDPVYIHPENAYLLAQAQAGMLTPTYTTLLTPFDPLVWDRQRARELFNFDYTIECYTPEAKRRYGYFSLPILSRGLLVGRLDAKAHRQKGLFEVRNLVLEPGIEPDARLVADIRQALQACADWHQTPQVTILHSEPETFAALFHLT